MKLIVIDDGSHKVALNPERVAFLNEGTYSADHRKAGEAFTRIFFSGNEEDYTQVSLPMLEVAGLIEHR